MLCACSALSLLKIVSEIFPETFCVSQEHYHDLTMLLKYVALIEQLNLLKTKRTCFT
jgi:hypothetical protein